MNSVKSYAMHAFPLCILLITCNHVVFDIYFIYGCITCSYGMPVFEKHNSIVMMRKAMAARSVMHDSHIYVKKIFCHLLFSFLRAESMTGCLNLPF